MIQPAVSPMIQPRASAPRCVLIGHRRRWLWLTRWIDFLAELSFGSHWTLSLTNLDRQCGNVCVKKHACVYRRDQRTHWNTCRLLTQTLLHTSSCVWCESDSSRLEVCGVYLCRLWLQYERVTDALVLGGSHMEQVESISNGCAAYHVMCSLTFLDSLCSPSSCSGLTVLDHVWYSETVCIGETKVVTYAVKWVNLSSRKISCVM